MTTRAPRPGWASGEAHGAMLKPPSPAEQARIVQLLIERVDVWEDSLEVRIRAEGLASLAGELRQQGGRRAA